MFHVEETNFLTTVMLLCDSTPISADTARGQNEELSLLDEDDTRHPADEIHGMEIPAFKRLLPLLLIFRYYCSSVEY